MGLLNSLLRFLCGQDFDGGKHYVGRPYYDSIPSGGIEFENFMAAGGTFIQPATNTTHLYYEAKKVYDKLPDDVLRYLVLQIILIVNWQGNSAVDKTTEVRYNFGIFVNNENAKSHI